MTRLFEIALLLTPLIGFAIWRFSAPSERLSGWLLAGVAGAVALLVALLLVLRQFDAKDGASAYLPAHMENGRVIPSHAGLP